MDREIELEAGRLLKRTCGPSSNARAVVRLLDERGAGPLECVLIGSQLIMLGQLIVDDDVRRIKREMAKAKAEADRDHDQDKFPELRPEEKRRLPDSATLSQDHAQEKATFLSDSERKSGPEVLALFCEDVANRGTVGASVKPSAEKGRGT